MSVSAFGMDEQVSVKAFLSKISFLYGTKKTKSSDMVDEENTLPALITQRWKITAYHENEKVGSLCYSFNGEIHYTFKKDLDPTKRILVQQALNENFYGTEKLINQQ